MESNKTGKYLKYAVGEILLIVIGILLAVQISNWNELNKEQEIEKEYLHRFQNDLQKDFLYLNKKISFAQNHYESFHSFIVEMHNSQNTKEEVTKLISLYVSSDI